MNEQEKTQLIGAIYREIQSRGETFAKIAANARRDDRPELIVETELELFCSRIYSALSVKRPGTITETQALAIFTKVLASGLTFSEVANHIYLAQFPGSGGAITYHPTVEGIKAIKSNPISTQSLHNGSLKVPLFLAFHYPRRRLQT